MASGHVETHLVLEVQAGDEKPGQVDAQEIWQALHLPLVFMHP